MIEFGAALKRAREAKGMTTAQLAQATHLMVQQIEALENEDFSKIAAPIYGRGFVKLYCEAVGLEAQPMITEFMELYSGNRPPTIRTRAPKTVAPPPPQHMEMPDEVPPPEPEPQPVMQAMPEENLEDFGSPAEPESDDGFALESEVIPAARPKAKAPVEQSLWSTSGETGELPFPEDEPTPTRKPSRFMRPAPIDDEEPRGRFKLPFRFSLADLPQSTKRLLLLGVAGVILLWLLIVGFRSAYRAVMGPSAEEPKEAETTEQAETTEARPTTGTDGRSLKAIPVRYVDSY